jgi:hypothetical protein
MIENTENTAPAEQGATATPATPAELVIADLEAKVKQLEQQLQWAKDARDHNGKKLDEIRSYIQNSIDNGDWTDEELEEIFWEELADKLDLEIMKTVEVIITAEWSATVKMKRGQDLDDLDISVEEPEISRFGKGELTDVYERSFDITEA